MSSNCDGENQRCMYGSCMYGYLVSVPVSPLRRTADLGIHTQQQSLWDGFSMIIQREVSLKIPPPTLHVIALMDDRALLWYEADRGIPTMKSGQDQWDFCQTFQRESITSLDILWVYYYIYEWASHDFIISQSLVREHSAEGQKVTWPSYNPNLLPTRRELLVTK